MVVASFAVLPLQRARAVQMPLDAHSRFTFWPGFGCCVVAALSGASIWDHTEDDNEDCPILHKRHEYCLYLFHV